MDIIILGGNSPRHKQWVRDLREVLLPHADAVTIIDYLHWETGAAQADIETEIDRLASHAQRSDEYILVAKSIGTVIAALAQQRGVVRPEACVYLGVPLETARYEGVRFDILPKTTFIQNVHDPLGSSEQLKAYITAHPPQVWKLLEEPYATHNYMDFQMIEREVKAYM